MQKLIKTAIVKNVAFPLREVFSFAFLAHLPQSIFGFSLIILISLVICSPE